MKAKHLFAILLCTLSASAFAAPGDQSVTFYVPYSVAKLDPYVAKMGLECRFTDANKNPLPGSGSGVVEIGPVTNGGRSGQQGITATVPAAQLHLVKGYMCHVWLYAIDGKSQVAVTDLSQNVNAAWWSLVAPNSKARVEGTF